MKRYVVETHGCQMNVHDSRRIEEVLHAAGYERADDAEDADVLVINTCSVREKAEHKLMSLLGTTRPWKEGRAGRLVAVAGCVAQQEGDKLLGKAPQVDVVLGPDNIGELPSLLEHARSEHAPIARTVFDVHDPRFLDATSELSRRDREVSSFVTVMKGCDERCTFCIVPTTRGPERYRASDDIVREVRSLVDGGVREITLLGQTVNSWHEPGADDSGESQFARLLERIASDVPGLARLRYTSPHPRHVTPALVRAHRDLEVLPAHVHLPVQSGSDRVLKRMLRRYTRADYLERTRALKSARARFTLSTDLIVGFPGETEAEFAETLSLVREVGFSAAFCFKYSPRPHTPALRLGDDVTEATKDERLARLFEVVEACQAANLSSLVGTRTKVLFEGVGKESRWKGRSDRHEIVHVETPDGVDLRGQLLEVEITRANAHSLLGTLSASLGELPPRPPARTRLPVTRS